jgi:transaldolase
MTRKIETLKVKIFSDGADKQSMLQMYQKPFIKGLTTNPTLMNKAGIRNYEEFCKDILKTITDKPISFEVFSDDFQEMEDQAMKISSWGKNVYVKIPITNTKGAGSYRLINKLSQNNVKLNITALMTNGQVEEAIDNLSPSVASYISIFAGRIADTGRDPVPIMIKAINTMQKNQFSELIWASPRELLNIYQANEIGCHIITVTQDILKKLNMVGYDLDIYSLDTVKMFYSDALIAGFKI